MGIYAANYPYHPTKTKSIFFRFLAPNKRLNSLFVSEGTAYDDRNVYPVVSDSGRTIENHLIVFTSKDYCYFTGHKSGIIVQKNGDWYKGEFDANQQPVSGVLCKEGNLIFYFCRIPLLSTKSMGRHLVTLAIFAAVFFFGWPYLNMFSEKETYSKIGDKIQEFIYGKKPEVVNVDYSKLDPNDPVEQWRPKGPLTGIIGTYMQEGVNLYIQGKQKFQERDYKAAYMLFAKSSSRGFTPGYYKLGIHFLKGSPDRKMASNAEYAKIHFRLAAKKNHGPAQYELAKCYLKGIGTPKSMKLATYWAYKSAISGYVPAQRMLGNILLKNNKADLARQWLLCASCQGDTEAQKMLKEGAGK